MKDEKNKALSSANNLSKIVDRLIENINSRQQDILKMRFGLDKKDPQSLNSIGNKLNITRERVRQIESDSFEKLRQARKDKEFDNIIKKAIKIINSFGGVCEKRTLKGQLIEEDITQLQRRRLMVILNSSKRLFFQKSSKNLNAYWYIDKNLDKKKSENNIIKLTSFIEIKNHPISFSTIFKYATTLNDLKIKDSRQDKKYVRMLLHLSKKLERNILEEWGARKWGLISGKGSREKAYLVLKKNNKPLHFRELTNEINKYWKNKKALPQTVHNELIKDDNFVQVGKGTYGLSEWGILKGTVKDVIIKLLEENEKGVSKEDIINYVLGQKQVKKTTVLINLTDKVTFSKNSQGYFFLR